MEDNKELIELAKQKAIAAGLDPALVCAVVEQESRWNTDAIRFEPDFYTRYITKQNLASVSEAFARAFSWGLMQVMGQVAREAGFNGPYLSSLCKPAIGLEIGCKVLKHKLAIKATLEDGLLAWNGGARKEYAAEVIARIDKYRE